MLKKYFIKLLVITSIISSLNIHCMSENTKNSFDAEEELDKIMRYVFDGIVFINDRILSIDTKIEWQKINIMRERFRLISQKAADIEETKNNINLNIKDIKHIIETIMEYKDTINIICLKYKSDIDNEKIEKLLPLINSNTPETLEYFLNYYYPEKSSDLLLKSGICIKDYEIIKYVLCKAPEDYRFEDGVSPLEYSETLGSDHQDVTNFIKNYEKKIRFICKHNLIKKYNQYIAKQIVASGNIISALSNIISEYAEPQVYELSNDQIDVIINFYGDIQKEDCEKLS